MNCFGIHSVAVSRVIDRYMVDLKFIRDSFVQIGGMYVPLQRVAGKLGQTLPRQIGVERFVSHSDDYAFLTSLPAVQGCVVQTHIPGSRVGLVPVTAASALEPDLIQMFGYADVGFKLGDLDRCGIVGQIPDSHDHKFHILIVVQNSLHDSVKGSSRLKQRAAHGSRDIQCQDHRYGLRMLLVVTALSDDLIGIQIRSQFPRKVHVLRAPHTGCIDISVGADLSSPSCVISVKILSSPITSAHLGPPFIDACQNLPGIFDPCSFRRDHLRRRCRLRYLPPPRRDRRRDRQIPLPSSA